MKKMFFAKSAVVMVAVFTLVFACSALADEKSGSSYDKKGDRMSVHKDMYVDMMVMLKDTMEIVKNMSHKPSEADKEKLDGMIKKLDKMISVKREMMEKKEMMKKNGDDKK